MNQDTEITEMGGDHGGPGVMDKGTRENCRVSEMPSASSALLRDLRVVCSLGATR